MEEMAPQARRTPTPPRRPPEHCGRDDDRCTPMKFSVGTGIDCFSGGLRSTPRLQTEGRTEYLRITAPWRKDVGRAHVRFARTIRPEQDAEGAQRAAIRPRCSMSA